MRPRVISIPVVILFCVAAGFAGSATRPDTSGATTLLRQETADLHAWVNRDDRTAAWLHEGEDIAGNRVRLLRELARIDPRAVIEHALTPESYAALPAEIQAQSERPISTVGDFEVLCAMAPEGSGHASEIRRSVVIDGQHYPAAVFGRRLEQSSKERIPINGVLIDGTFVFDDRAIQEVDPATSPINAQATNSSAISTGEVIGRSGGKLYRFSSRQALLEVETRIEISEQALGTSPTAPFQQLIEQPSLQPEATAANSAANGPKKILVIRVDFSDFPGDPKTGGSTAVTQDYGENLFTTKIVPFYAASSYGHTSVSATVTEKVYRLSKTGTYYATNNDYSGIRAEAKALAAVDYPGPYDRYIYVFSNLGSIPDSKFSGWAGLGGGIDVWINGDYTLRVVAHELGHCCGVLHANLWQVSDGNPISASGSHVEYGDLYDIMGSDGGGGMTADFNPQFKTVFGWLDTVQTAPVTTNGTYRLYMFDTPTRPATDLVAITCQKSPSSRYVISYRGTYSYSYSTPPPFTITSGAYIVRTESSTGTATELLDMTTPGSSTHDAALAPGASFVDTQAGFSVKTIGVGGSGNDKYLDVEVGFFDSNKLPSITLGDTTFGATVSIGVRVATTPSRVQLFIDGTLQQESTDSNPAFSWEPDAVGAHTIVVKAQFADGTEVRNSCVANVGLPRNWTWVTPLPQGNTPSALAYGLGQWWATADYGNLIASTDGSTWVKKPAPARTRLQSIASDGSQLILTCYSTEVATGTTYKTLWRSTDGTAWSPVTSGISTPQYVYYLNNTWVVLGDSNKIATSTDGQTWHTPVSLPIPNGARYVAYANGRWAVTGYNGAIATSTDLTTWTSAGALPASGTTPYGIAATDKLWLVSYYGSGTYGYYTSTDLSTWTPVTAPDGNNYPSCVTQLDGQFVVCTYNNVSVSADGQTWTKYPLPVSALCDVHAQAGVYVGAGTQAKMFTGSSLSALTVSDSYPRPNIYGAVATAEGDVLFTTGAYSSTNNTSYSPIARLQQGTLQATSLNTSYAMYGIAARNGLYVAVGSSGRIYTSPDGSTWTNRPSGTSSSLNAIVATTRGFVAAGLSGTILTSPDGLTWTARATGTTQTLQALATDGSTTVAVGTGGTILRSVDDGTWTSAPSGTSNSLSCIVWQPGLGFCIPTSSLLMVSADGAAWKQNAMTITWNAAAATPYGLVLGSSSTSAVAVTLDGTNLLLTAAPAYVNRLFYANGTLYMGLTTGLLSLPFRPSPGTVPAFTTQPATQTVQEGRSASFIATATGSFPMQCQWYHDGVAISGATTTSLVLDPVQKSDAGQYSVKLTNKAGAATSAVAVLTVTDTPIHVVSTSAPQSQCLGGATSFTVNATGDGTLTYQWYLNGQAIAGATGCTLNVSGVTCQSYGRYTARITSPSTFLTTPAMILAPPAIIQGVASSLTLLPAETYALTVQDPIADVTYQWSVNGVSPSGATGPTLLGQTAPTDATKSITVTASINGVSSTSNPVSVNTATTTNIGHLANVSVLTLGGSGAEALALGFVSNGPKSLLIRAIGPSLGSFGVTDCMSDPHLTLFLDAKPVMQNNDWEGTAALEDAFNRTGAFGLDHTSKDAALLATISGLYSAQVEGSPAGSTGQAMIEVYDTNVGDFTTTTPRLINLSCRALVGPGAKAVSVGFVVTGNTAKTVLIRAIGPGLAAYGLGGTLNDPKLALFSHSQFIAGNDNWGETVPSSVFDKTGAFALSDPKSKDAAIVITLPPGLYSAQVTPADAGTGIALVEVYEVP